MRVTGKRWTHKGWFGVCPVYLRDVYTDELLMEPRHWLFELLFVFSHYGFAALIFLVSLVNPDYEPGWPVRITGQIDKAIEGEE